MQRLCENISDVLESMHKPSKWPFLFPSCKWEFTLGIYRTMSRETSGCKEMIRRGVAKKGWDPLLFLVVISLMPFKVSHDFKHSNLS